MSKIPAVVLPSTDPAITPDKKTMKLYHEVMGLIGELTTAWAMLDHDLIDLMARLMVCHPRAAGIAFFSINSFSTRINILKALAKHTGLDKKGRDSLLQMLDKLLRYAITRNEIVHSAYVLTIADSENGKKLRNKQVIHRHTFRSERDKLHTIIRAQTGEIRQNIKDVERVRSWIKLFLFSFGAQVAGRASLPKKPA